MRLRPGLCLGPHWGSLQRSPRPLAGNGEGPRERGGKERRRGGKGRGGVGRGGVGSGGEGWEGKGKGYPQTKILATALARCT